MIRSAENEHTMDIHGFPATPEEMHSMLESERKYPMTGYYHRRHTGSIRYSEANVFDNVDGIEGGITGGQFTGVLHGLPINRKNLAIGERTVPWDASLRP